MVSMSPKITRSLLLLQNKKYKLLFKWCRTYTIGSNKATYTVGSFIAATSSMLCLFLDQNKDYSPEDGFPAIFYLTVWSTHQLSMWSHANALMAVNELHRGSINQTKVKIANIKSALCCSWIFQSLKFPKLSNKIAFW
jgi:hypothetical protein